MCHGVLWHTAIMILLINSCFHGEICISSKQMSPRSRVACCFITSLSFIIFFPIIWFFGAPIKPYTTVHNATKDGISYLNRTITLQAVLVSADILQATMVVEWSVRWDTCSYPQNDNCTATNIFFITNLSPSDPGQKNRPYNNNIPIDPIFIWNPSMRGYNNAEHNYVTFRTELTLSVTSPDDKYILGAINPISISFYPFDYYYANVFAFGQDMSTNESVSVDLGSVYTLISGFDFSSEIGNGYSDELVASDLLPRDTHIFFKLQRSTPVIVYCLIITFTFWMVTLMICLIMIATVFFGFRQRNEIVVVPIGTVFAFTQLRSSMPGAPDGFGDVLDFYGLLPCLILLSISAIAMVGIYLFANPDDPSRKVFTWSEFKDARCYYMRNIWKTSKKWVWRARLCIPIGKRIQRVPQTIEIPLINTAPENQA